jgi:tRNA-splicing ligase RtcB
VNSYHDYVERDHHFDVDVWVTRKDEIRALDDDLDIISGSTGTLSYTTFAARKTVHGVPVAG